jgi:hypothetical protein
MMVSTIMGGELEVAVYIPNGEQQEIHRYLVGYQEAGKTTMDNIEVCTYTYEHAKQFVNKRYKTPVVKSITYLERTE